ncbi:MAG: hypothetical protein U0359_26310 [Byssovorax sp.]
MTMPGFSAEGSLYGRARTPYARPYAPASVVPQAQSLYELSPGCDDPSMPGCGGGGPVTGGPFSPRGPIPPRQLPLGGGCQPRCYECVDGVRECITAKCNVREVACKK